MNRIGNFTRLICTLLYVMTTHTCIPIYCSVYPQLPPIIGAPWGCCGHASGIYFPRPPWFSRCATHAIPCSVPAGYSYFRMCLEKSERNRLTSHTCTMKQSSRVFSLFECLKGCFRLRWSTRDKNMRTVTSKKHLLRSLLQP